MQKLKWSFQYFMKSKLFKLVIWQVGGILLSNLLTSSAWSMPTDPTRPPDLVLFKLNQRSANEVMNSTQRLTAIFVYPHYKIAIIDNQVKRTGDRVGEYVVTSIKRNVVELTGNHNKRMMLKLSPTIKQITRD